jgi:hypothetical protein
MRPTTGTGTGQGVGGAARQAGQDPARHGQGGVRLGRFTICVSPTHEELWRGVVRPGEAARIMGLTHWRLVEAAEREGIDRRHGYQVRDLIRMATKLTVLEHDPEQKARLRAAVSTFRAFQPPAIDGRTLYLGNPPYVRHPQAAREPCPGS